MTDSPRLVRAADYRPFSHLVPSIELFVDLQADHALVRSKLKLERNPRADPAEPLRLDGENLELVSVSVDGARLGAERYALEQEALVLAGLPERCELEIVTRIEPAKNTQLSGLYKSGGMHCTQCEAEGFRRITYFPDRPDVMALYSTTIEADRAECPVLLANGNLVETGEAGEGRHWARWDDPFPKPCYLFAMVAGDLAHIEDRFTTASGREVTLRIYTEAHNVMKCDHAMASLKRAMRWDEETFGREYDLDIFMIVAVDDFNMGAMENKGLNIFNSSVVLALPEATTDDVFGRIEGVVAHEYFHNWTGNRITCRDWFQLTLKEGLTVFRDQEFSADMGSRPVQRISDVQTLRSRQFPEDASPMAHAIQPATYLKIDNFYTMTVYEKGAEVIRMLRTLLGAEGFRKGMDRYFEKHDGQAVTTDDFVRALEEGSDADLGQFRRWYRQTGTPRLKVERRWDAAAGRLTLELSQQVPGWTAGAAPGPLHVPVALGLLDAEGLDLSMRLAGEAADAPGAGETTRVLELVEEKQSFVFEGLAAEPTPSLLRGFSAPVRLELERDGAELAFLFARDSDPFARWEAGQTLFRDALLRMTAALEQGIEPAVEPAVLAACRATLADADSDPAFIARALTLPGFQTLEQELPVVPVEALLGSVRRHRAAVAGELRGELLALIERYDGLLAGPHVLDPVSNGRRALSNLALGLLAELDEPAMAELAMKRFRSANCMTDSIGALTALIHTESPLRDEALAEFYARWKNDPVVLNNWFNLQAVSRRADTLDRVRSLMDHEAFDLRNPNKVRALLVGFSQSNPGGFHGGNGEGYAFLADQALQVDALNAQMGASLVRGLIHWKRFDETRARQMRGQLERIVAAQGLSRNAYEIASRSLES